LRKIVLALLVCSSLANPAASQETFDVVRYTPPAGWKKDVTRNMVVYSTTDAGAGTWCQISIIRSTVSRGGLDADFKSEWQELIVKNYAPAEAPQMSEASEKDGWQVKSGGAPFVFEKSKAVALLTVMSGFGRSASVMAASNSGDYGDAIQALLSSVELIRPATAGPRPPIAGEKAGGASLLGTWGASASDQSSFRMKNGIMNYIKRQYTFNADGTYIFLSKTFDPLMDKILLGRENGTYRVEGGLLSVRPVRSVLEAWSKKDGADKWGRLLSTQNVPLESADYRFTRHYFSGLREWSLVLQSDRQTRRDGPFSGNTAFERAWLYGPPCADCFIKLPN
jgi:hypothetical protein